MAGSGGAPRPSVRWAAGAAGLLVGGAALASSTAVLENCAEGYARACAWFPGTPSWIAIAVVAMGLIAVGAYGLGHGSVAPTAPVAGPSPGQGPSLLR